MTTTATAKNVTVKDLSGGLDTKLILTPRESFGMVTWTVSHADTGHVYGTLESHEGTTDLTPRANTYRSSKPKTLWTVARNGRPDHIDYTSRATALRALIRGY